MAILDNVQNYVSSQVLAIFTNNLQIKLSLIVIANILIFFFATFDLVIFAIETELIFTFAFNQIKQKTFYHSHKKQIVWKHGPKWPFYAFMLRTKLC